MERKEGQNRLSFQKNTAQVVCQALSNKGEEQSESIYGTHSFRVCADARISLDAVRIREL